MVPTELRVPELGQPYTLYDGVNHVSQRPTNGVPYLGQWCNNTTVTGEHVSTLQIHSATTGIRTPVVCVTVSALTD